MTEPLRTIEPWHTPNDHDLPAGDQTIRTISGRYINLLQPDPYIVWIGDIAHALAHINRFGGHTDTPYSVAEHSLGVANMLLRSTGDTRTALFGLLHDASEAYLGDMVRPLKRQIPAYRYIEANMEIAISSALIPPAQDAHDCRRWELVKAADSEILAFEMSVVRNAEWRVPPDPAAVKSAFLSRYKEWN